MKQKSIFCGVRRDASRSEATQSRLAPQNFNKIWHLKIKKFWGTTENAVRIQIYIAISTFLLVTIVKNEMKLQRSTYEILQILSISLTDKTHLTDLFDKTKFQNDKELLKPNGPTLFNF